MSRSCGFIALLAAVLLFSDRAVLAADNGKAAGILMVKKNDAITVKVDGEDEPRQFLLGSDKKVADSMKGIFDACRVTLTYKKVGEVREIVAIKRQVLKAKGTITGTVVKVHNDFWVEVKPKNGPADAFAPGGNYKDKEFMDRLKSLKKGDSVTITYTTDFERHRIAKLKKN